jgi:hypothetical protein
LSTDVLRVVYLSFALRYTALHFASSLNGVLNVVRRIRETARAIGRNSGSASTTESQGKSDGDMGDITPNFDQPRVYRSYKLCAQPKWARRHERGRQKQVDRKAQSEMSLITLWTAGQTEDIWLCPHSATCDCSACCWCNSKFDHWLARGLGVT